MDELLSQRHSANIDTLFDNVGFVSLPQVILT